MKFRLLTLLAVPCALSLSQSRVMAYEIQGGQPAWAAGMGD